MEREDTHGQMGNHMMETGWQAREKDMAYTYIQMVTNMKGSSRMTTNMEEACSLKRMGNRRKESGLMA